VKGENAAERNLTFGARAKHRGEGEWLASTPNDHADGIARFPGPQCIGELIKIADRLAAELDQHVAGTNPGLFGR
jgi:hypothetical protein